MLVFLLPNFRACLGRLLSPLLVERLLLACPWYAPPFSEAKIAASRRRSAGFEFTAAATADAAAITAASHYH